MHVPKISVDSNNSFVCNRINVSTFNCKCLQKCCTPLDVDSFCRAASSEFKVITSFAQKCEDVPQCCIFLSSLRSV